MNIKQISNILLVIFLKLLTVVSEVPDPISDEVQNGSSEVSSHTKGLLLAAQTSKHGKGRKIRRKHKNRHQGMLLLK